MTSKTAFLLSFSPCMAKTHSGIFRRQIDSRIFGRQIQKDRNSITRGSDIPWWPRLNRPHRHGEQRNTIPKRRTEDERNLIPDTYTLGRLDTPASLDNSSSVRIFSIFGSSDFWLTDFWSPPDCLWFSFAFVWITFFIFNANSEHALFFATRPI